MLAFFFLPSLALAETYNPQTLPFEGSNLTALAWSPDGARIAACALSGPCRVWNAATGKPLATAPNIGPGEQQSDAITFSPDGQTLLIDAPGGITIWPWSSGAAPHIYNFPAPYAGLGTGADALQSCGPTAPLVEFTGDAKSEWALLLQPTSFTIQRAIPLTRFAVGASCPPHGAFALVTIAGALGAVESLDNPASVIPLRPQFAEQPVNPKMQVLTAAQSPNGKLIAAGGDLEDWAKLPDGSFHPVSAPYSVRLIAWPQNQDIGGLFANNNYVFTLSFSPDSRFLAAALDHQVAVQRLSPPGPAKALTAPSDGYLPISFSPASDILAVGAGDRVLLFDMKNVY